MTSNSLIREEKKTGNLEIFNQFEIHGWFIDEAAGNFKLDLKLIIDNEQYLLNCSAEERSDVAEQFGNQFLTSGFHCNFNNETSKLLVLAHQQKKQVSILVNDSVLLEKSLELIDSNVLILPDLQNKKELQSEIILQKAVIEKVDNFTVTGWAIKNNYKCLCREDFEITCNGEILEAPVIVIPRPDVSDLLGIEESNVGFEIILPGEIWAHQSDSLYCEIGIFIRGEKLISEGLKFSRGEAINWLSEIATLSINKSDRWLLFLAIEHLYSGKFKGELRESILEYFVDAVEKDNLSHLVSLDLDANPSRDSSASTESVSTLLLWKAMRELNVVLLENPNCTNTSELIIDCLKRYKLSGEAREWYLLLATQLTCENGEFRKLASNLDLNKFKEFADLSKNYDIDKLSLALPILVIEKEIDWAVSVLHRIKSNLFEGWLHTCCIRFSLEEVQDFYELGEIDNDTLESYHHAVLELLKGFKGEWFSRLHDYDLVKAIVSILSDLEMYKDGHQRYLVRESLSIYGLNPIFWKLLISNGVPQKNQELSWGKAHFYEIHNHLTQSHSTNIHDFALLRESIGFFDMYSNVESLILRRELCMNYLVQFNHSSNQIGSANILSDLLNLDASSALRVNAFPLEIQNCLTSKFIQTNGSSFQTILRNSSSIKGCISSLSTNCASSILKQLDSDNQSHVNRHIKDVEESLVSLERICVTLGTHVENYIAFDLLSKAFSLSSRLSDERISALVQMRKILEVALENNDLSHYIPAPILSGLANLKSLSKKLESSLLQRVLYDFDILIKQSIKDISYTCSLSSKKNLLISSPEGWLSDTLVAIFTTKDSLTSKLSNHYHFWLDDLAQRNIRHIFVVGDGDDTFKDNVLSLKVDDSFDDLPTKVMKFWNWIYQNTDFEYVIKLNEDCYLNVDNYFDSLSYRKFFYYGYIVELSEDQFDRTEHQQKSQRSYGKARLDLSPTPSIYADSRFGYCLSRLAIYKLVENLSTFDGQLLAQTSTRADKLVGDVLALSSIYPNGENFDCFSWRKTSSNSIPVAMQQNTFFPGQLNTTKVAYLEGSNIQVQSHRQIFKDELWPKKIWPTCWDANVRSESNQLELLTEPKHAVELLRYELVVLAVVRNEMVILEHFLEHYRDLGTRCFIFVDNCSDDGTREFLLTQPDVVLYSSDTQYKNSHYGVAWQQAVLGNLCLGKWVVVADADEFLVYKDSEHKSLTQLTREMEIEGANGALVYMIDMYPYEDLDDACFNKQKPFVAAPYFDKNSLIELKFGGGMYSNSKNFVNGFRHRVVESRINAYVSQKYALFRYYPWLRFSEGIHYAANMELTKEPVFFAHFKYHSEFKEKVLNEIERNQHFNGAEEYKRYISLLEESKGGYGSEKWSLKYDGSHSFLEVFK